jgi:hypothetical protein
MADWYGQDLSKDMIRERTGDVAQICDARRVVYREGRAAGVEAIEVTTAAGLAFTVLPSRGMDISRTRFRGIPVSWLSATGEASPLSYQPEGLEWLRGFFGGLLTTCGLTYAAHPCEDGGVSLGLHGRAAYIPAEDVNIEKGWIDGDYRVAVSGTVREASVFGDNLVLHRRISTSLESATITVSDEIENIGFRTSPLMMLYHVNIGWPVLSESTRLVARSTGQDYLDDRARSEPDGWQTFLPPQPGYEERVYRHQLEPDSDGYCTVALVNESREIGVSLRFLRSEFPHFIQWKMMGQGEYVVGIEPCNITGNRAKMRADGTLEYIEPGARRTFTLEIGITSGTEALTSLIQTIEP